MAIKYVQIADPIAKSQMTVWAIGDGTSTSLAIPLSKSPIGLEWDVGDNIPSSAIVQVSGVDQTNSLDTATMVLSITFATAPTNGTFTNVYIYLLYDGA